MKKQLQHIFQHGYPGTESIVNYVLKQLFKGDTMIPINSDIIDSDQMRRRADQANIQSAKHVMDIERIDSDPIAVYEVVLKKGSKIAQSRVGIKQFITSEVMTYTHAFILFHYDNEPTRPWRFSYVYKEHSTYAARAQAKRYTYVFGENYTSRTAVERFIQLASSPKKDTDFAEAFSVEALGDEFFDEYKLQYIKFIKYISGKVYEKKNGIWKDVVYHEPQPFYSTSFSNNDKAVRDYVKKLFGRIVFMYFLQKKQWLGGDRNYMTNLYRNADSTKRSAFLETVLRPLFFGVLNTPYDKRDIAAKSLPGWNRIPYLNGGLFQQDEMDMRECHFPGEYFEEFFSFLDKYNFTIDENDPEDAEIGIDPEMLGRIFENLLEDNKDKGAYYTPKEIVDYMCRESIISYLQDESFTTQGNLKIKEFIETLDADSLSERQRIYLKEKLKKVKICDPAIGSGAFPMGMVILLSKLYSALNLVSNRKNMKRYIMEKSIYGVDIEKGAVDIARLRFWLAMVVEDDTTDITQIAPLPNLGYKIMQGNSLLERYGGIDLSSVLGKSLDDIEFESGDPLLQKSLDEKLRRFYNAKRDERDSLTTEIEDLISDRLRKLNSHLDLSSIKMSENDQFFMWHTWFSDVFKDGGFDIVIGNPPYGAKLSDTDKATLKSVFYTTQTIKGIQKGSMDTYTMFIELSYKLLKKGGAFAMIVPISLTSSDALSGVHRILTLRCDDVRISSYAVRPQPVFKNAVVNTSILLFRKTGERCTSFQATKMYRKGRNFNLKRLIDNLEYIDVKDYTLFGRIPKISLQIEKDILSKLKKHSALGHLIQSSGKPIYYRTTGGRYFKVVTNYPTGSTKEKPIYFDEKMADAIGCILSSSLSFWFYQIYSNNLDWKSVEIAEFPIPVLTEAQITQLSSLYQEYQKDIERNANIRTSSGRSKYNVTSFKEYKIGKSKSIIDKIDDMIGPIYGLSTTEIEFIKNYEIEFRLTDEEG